MVEKVKLLESDFLENWPYFYHEPEGTLMMMMMIDFAQCSLEFEMFKWKIRMCENHSWECGS